MNLTRCEKGHFFDADRFQTCPHCAGMSEMKSMALTEAYEEMDYTVPLTEDALPPVENIQSVASKQEKPINSMAPVSTPSSLQDAISQAKQMDDDEDGQKTVSYYDNAIGSEPVVGWLVCIEGANFGQDFRLKSGRNFIGRASSMDVVLDGDNTISREKHAVILFEPKKCLFLVQPGDSRELFYLNDDVVLSPTQIVAYDQLTIGDTKLVFIPCCNDRFNWNDYEGKKEDK